MKAIFMLLDPFRRFAVTISADNLRALAPGLLLCGLIALAAQFLSEHYGAPAMLMSLLLGLAVHPLADEGSKATAGVAFSAKTVLRLGVALLGARISFDIFVALGFEVLVLIVAALTATIAISFLLARLLGRGWRLAILTGGAVSICGASAALAISAILPRNEYTERNLSFTVFSVTLLSTLAMIAYPIAINLLGFDDHQAGIFLGGTIHDVAQVVGAGFSISDAAGETATTVKLLRVSLLAPIVLVLGVAMSQLKLSSDDMGKTPPLVPGFIVGFAALVVANSLGWLPAQVQEAAANVSRWAMLVAIAAVGVKTELKRLSEIPIQSIILVCLQTLFIAAFIYFGTLWIG